jgi:chaperone modulatory protein CbpM
MSNNETVRGQLIDEESLITLQELCQHCTVETLEIITLVSEGILDPCGACADEKNAADWRFHISSVRRVTTTIRLQRDLGVNLPGAALALDLLDRIADLQNQQANTPGKFTG